VKPAVKKKRYKTKDDGEAIIENKMWGKINIEITVQVSDTTMMKNDSTLVTKKLK
jgi:hypothetical protein